MIDKILSLLFDIAGNYLENLSQNPVIRIIAAVISVLVAISLLLSLIKLALWIIGKIIGGAAESAAELFVKKQQERLEKERESKGDLTK